MQRRGAWQLTQRGVRSSTAAGRRQRGAPPPKKQRAADAFSVRSPASATIRSAAPLVGFDAAIVLPVRFRSSQALHCYLSAVRHLHCGPAFALQSMRSRFSDSLDQLGCFMFGVAGVVRNLYLCCRRLCVDISCSYCACRSLSVTVACVYCAFMFAGTAAAEAAAGALAPAAQAAAASATSSSGRRPVANTAHVLHDVS